MNSWEEINFTIKVPEGFSDTMRGIGEGIPAGITGKRFPPINPKLLRGIALTYGKIGVSEVEPESTSAGVGDLSEAFSTLGSAAETAGGAMSDLSEALLLTGAFKSSGEQQIPLKWAKPDGGNLFAELKAACERISELRTPVIIVPDGETREIVQGLVDGQGKAAEVITRQEYWEQEAARNHIPLFPRPLPFELTHTPRNRKERRHGGDY